MQDYLERPLCRCSRGPFAELARGGVWWEALRLFRTELERLPVAVVLG